MKIILPLILCFVFGFQELAFSQDTIYFKRHEKEIARLLEVNPTEVVYRKISYLDGPVFRTLKSDIDSIRFANGMREIFGQVPVSKTIDSLAQAAKEASFRNERQSYAQGVSDADYYYRGYKGIGAACYISGLFYYMGLPVPIVGSITRPTNMYRYVPDRKRYDTDTPYFNGFNSRARSIKSHKAWANFGYGAATTTGVFLILLISAISTIN